MNKQTTSRGFAYYEFTDDNGETCNIQKSSAGENDYIWLGFKNIGLMGFVPYGTPTSWRDITDEEIKEKFGLDHISANTRMHLSREQVAELLPILQRFVDTGEI